MSRVTGTGGTWTGTLTDTDRQVQSRRREERVWYLCVLLFLLCTKRDHDCNLGLWGRNVLRSTRFQRYDPKSSRGVWEGRLRRKMSSSKTFVYSFCLHQRHYSLTTQFLWTFCHYRFQPVLSSLFFFSFFSRPLCPLLLRVYRPFRSHRFWKWSLLTSRRNPLLWETVDL